jgi:hypothetical protein
MYGPVIQGKLVRLRRRREKVFVGGRWLDEILTEVLRSDWERAQSKAPVKRQPPRKRP